VTDRIEVAMTSDLVNVPADFRTRVMAEIQVQALPVRAASRAQWRAAIEWLALAGTVAAGLAQLLPLLFGLWIFSNAS